MKFAMRWKLLPAMVVILLAFSVHPAKATIQTSSSLIQPYQVFDSLDNTVTVSISGATSSTVSYLRPVFYTSGTSNYFGCVKTTCGTYYCGTDPTKYPSITGNGSYTMTIRSDTSSSGFTGSGTYQFKVRRCTASSCSGDYDSSPQTVEITQSSSSPAPINKDDSCPFPSPTASATTTADPTSSPTPSPTPITTPQPDNITLSEVYACPSNGGNEWVEIANNNDTTVTLNNWELHDSTKTNKEVFTATIEAHGLLVYNLQSSMYNNDGDTVKLLKPDGTLLAGNTFSYNACDPNTTWAIDSSGVWHPAIPTPGKPNQFPSTTTTSSSSTTTPSSTSTTTASSSPTTIPASSVSTAYAPTASGSGDVLGMSAQEDPPANPTASSSAHSQKQTANSSKAMEIAAFGLIGVGLLSFASLGGYLVWEHRLKHGKRAKR